MHRRKKFNWIKVDAIGIEAIGYDNIKSRLFVKFRTKNTPYIYLNVNKEKYHELMNEEHKTTYLNKKIKPDYKFKRLPDECYDLQ
jgi:hypothetical protein